MESVLFIEALDGTTVRVLFDLVGTVSRLKELIYLRNGPSPEQQRLLFAGIQLEDERTLMSHNIGSDMILHLRLRLRGAANSIFGFDYASMVAGKPAGFSMDAPEYRSIAPGLNLEGRCKNKKCRAHGKMAWTNMGFKYSADDFQKESLSVGFNMGVVTHQARWPLCLLPVNPNSVNRCGFYDCEYAFEGYKKGANERICSGSRVEGHYKLEEHAYDEPLGICSWTYLMIAVKPL